MQQQSHDARSDLCNLPVKLRKPLQKHDQIRLNGEGHGEEKGQQRSLSAGGDSSMTPGKGSVGIVVSSRISSGLQQLPPRTEAQYGESSRLI